MKFLGILFVLLLVGTVGYWLGTFSVKSSSSTIVESGELETNTQRSTRSISDGVVSSARSLASFHSVEADETVLESSTEWTFTELNGHFEGKTGDELAVILDTLLKDGHPQEELIKGILIFHLIGNYPEEMLALKLKHPSLPVLHKTYRIWALTDPEAAFEHNRKLENETWYRQGFDSIIDGVSASNPKWALGAIDEYVDPNNGHYHRLFTRWATNAPEEAAEAVDLVPDEFRSAALRSIADNWPEVDDAAAERWLLTLNENDRETVLATFTARRKQLEGS